MMEENSNTNNSNQNSTMDTSGGASISATTSNNSNNSNSTSINAPSPHNNTGDQTNLPTTIQQSADRGGDDILKDLKTENPGSVKNEDNEKSDKSNSSNTGCSPLASVKEEMDLMHTLANVKKEENSVSPSMSPVGFGSIGNLAGHSNESGGRAITPGKETSAANNGNKNQKKSNVLTTSGGCVEHIGADLINSASNEACGVGGVGGNGGGGGGGGAKPLPSSNFNSEAIVNCSDYTQQQNHIFVFSTQLANKGAESVINGQFPNIIAYHCTQPATKSFLDDLFIKNPTKMSKLQRQNSLNIVNGPHWPGGNNNKPKLSCGGGGKPSLSKSCHELTNENEALMSWDNASHNLEGATNEALKMLDSLESGGMPGKGSAGGPIDDSKPSLQGVKVPDENLTPQQRQHREEQLAKLKKMTQFLFPENDSGASQLEQMAAGAGANLASLMANKSPTDMACLPGMPSPAGMGLNSLPNPNPSAPPQGQGQGQGPPGQAMRLGQGPPPPYNSKQRSASVPIATQSPNPASPHNPLSNLSLPSPNMDVNAPIMSTATTPTTSTSSGNTPTAHTANTKNPYPQEASPTTNSGNCGNNNRNRGNLHQYNSNPSTPLSHMSPKDLETFNPTGQPTGDVKNARPPGPQRCSSAEIPNIEGLFPPSSPGLNFPSHMANNPNSGVNAFKPTGGTTGLERQNSAPHFGRRPDNVPLNPNSNRMPPNKLSHAFDPISSLAQMSQQLATGNDMSGMGVISANDINPNMESLMSSLDAAAMEHCMSGKPGNMPGGGMPGNMPGGMPPHMNNPAAFMSNNCHMPGQMPGQRLMNPRMGGIGGGGFIPSTGVGMMREGPGNFPGGMPPSHRMPMGGMGGRMPANFGNIQVKASTPNTIQYMPVRPQNNNNNGNNNSGMRVPPSLDFLQRFANPKPSNSPNAMVGNPDVGQMNPNGPNDPNKMPNSPNMIGGGSAEMNFFQNYNQMNAMPEGMPGGMLSANEQQNAMMRGMRPMMRQQHMGHGGPNPGGNPGNRMQGPGGNLGPQDSMPGSAMFGGGPMGPGGHQMFPGGGPPGQKPMKGMPPSGPCQNMNAVNSNVNNMGQVPGGMGGGPMPLGGPGGLMGPNSNMPNGPQPPCGSGNGNYNSFPGNPSSDLKYAQQYHSFQQQLYATSTRSQQGGNNVNMNPAYFHNK